MTTNSTNVVTQRDVDYALKGLLNELVPTAHPKADAVIRELWAEVQQCRNAHLAPREVSDGDVERAKAVYRASAERDNCPFPVLIAGLRDVIQADRQRGGGVVMADASIIKAFEDELENDPSAFLSPGETVYQVTQDEMLRFAKALLAQRGQVREGWKLVPVDVLEDCVADACSYTQSSRGWGEYGRKRDAVRDKYKALLAAAPDADAEVVREAR